jgi:hypothetical protein
MNNADGLELRSTGDEGVEEDRRCRGRAMNIDLVSRPDPADGLRWGDDLHA